VNGPALSKKRQGAVATSAAPATRTARATSLGLAIATSRSQNAKLGNAATTYAAQTSCPTSCPFFNGGGCYAESGRVGFVTSRLNAAAAALPSGPREVAEAEAVEIDRLKVVPDRPLRLHTVGDCSTDEAALIVSAASKRYRERGGGPVWTYTHAWREVKRESWGEVSVFASCETAEDVRQAKDRGYQTSIVVEKFTDNKRHVLDASAGDAAGVEVLPCPQQTAGVTCSSCRRCFDDSNIAALGGYSIGFEVHGSPATVRHATKALLPPDDPQRRFGTRQLIPIAITELKALGIATTTTNIAKHLGYSPSTIAQMRKALGC
jgi:hypothetical protein